MKILMLASHFPPYHGGGYGRVAGSFAEGLKQRGHDITVLTTIADSPAIGEPLNLPIHQVFAKIRHGMNPFRLWHLSLRNYDTLKLSLHDSPRDVIFSCGSDGIGFLTYHAAITSDIPSLTYLGDTWLAQAWRSLPEYDPYIDVVRGGRKPGLRRWIKKMIGIQGVREGMPDLTTPTVFAPVTVISQFVLDDLRAAGAPVPLHVPLAYVPLSASFFEPTGKPIGHSGIREPTLRALFVSRVEKLKGPDLAIAAVAAARHNGIDVTLTIAGLSIQNMQPELKAQAKQLNIEKYIKYAGMPTDIDLVQLYRNHDVFLFPSRIVEGLGLVNCEAQACGLPIIGTADSGAAEVIRHGETGFRIAIDDHEAMARHLGELARDRALWERMSANALQSAKRFHPDRILDTLENALNDVVRA